VRGPRVLAASHGAGCPFRNRRGAMIGNSPEELPGGSGDLRAARVGIHRSGIRNYRIRLHEFEENTAHLVSTHVGESSGANCLSA